MKINILGTRGEIEQSAPYHAKKSGVLIDNTILLDIGDASFLAYNPAYILITHLHPDHAYFVRFNEKPDTQIPLYAPEQYLNSMHITHKPFHVDGYTITPIPTIHSIKVASNAYLIEHNNIRILYTGDMIWIEKKYHPLLASLDLVITEASFYRKGGMIRRQKSTGAVYGHTGVPDLIHLFKQYTNTMLFVHFGSWFYADIAQARKKFNELAKQHDIAIIVGYDGLEVDMVKT